MKWILWCAALPLLAYEGSYEAEYEGFSVGPLAAEEETQAQPKEMVNKKEPPPFDADLFRRDAQVYTINVEALYWMVAEGGLEYSIAMQNPGWGAPDVPTAPGFAQGNFNSARYSWEPGFRIGVSYFRAPRYWEMKVDYTRLSASGNDRAHKPPRANVFLNPTWPTTLMDSLRGAKSYIHLNYNVFDLLVDRFFNPNPHLRLRLVGGMSVAWMNQNWQISYFDAVNHGTLIRNKWRYVGAGLKTGTMIDWYWGGNIYVTGSGIIGAFMGGYWNKSVQTVNFQPAPFLNPKTPIRNFRFFDPHPAFTMQVLFGPSWQKNYCNNRVEIFAGYELNIWANLQEIYHSLGAPANQFQESWINSSLIALQGLTVRATVDF